MLIDQRIVEHEMDIGHFPRLTPDRGKELVTAFAQERYKGDAKAMDSALAASGLAASDLQNDLMRQEDLLTFLSLRFRPAVQLSDGEVQKYFRDNMRPGLSLNDFRAQIETRITNDRADVDLETWLRTQRKRIKIEYLDKELLPE